MGDSCRWRVYHAFCGDYLCLVDPQDPLCRGDRLRSIGACAEFYPHHVLLLLGRTAVEQIDQAGGNKIFHRDRRASCGSRLCALGSCGSKGSCDSLRHLFLDVGLGHRHRLYRHYLGGERLVPRPTWTFLGRSHDGLWRKQLDPWQSCGQDVPKLFGLEEPYVVIGIALGVVLALSAIIIDRPDETVALPSPKVGKGKRREDFEAKDYKPSEMIGRFTFWRAFVFLICISAVGNSVISFARDLALSTGASAALATTLVGVLAVCNGLGRIITGAVFDALGRRFTMTAASILTVVAAAITLVAVNLGSLPLCILGLCLVGMSYGTSPTVSSAFTMSFYGPKHFASNLGIMNFNLMCASFIATACTSILKSTGGYTMPFVLLLSLAVVALSLNFTIKKP